VANVGVEGIVAEMLALFWAKTGIEPDAVPGDVLRTLFEAVAFQVEDAEARFREELARAIPEAVFAAFGFERRRGARAVLTLRFSRSTPAPEAILVPAGTRARSTNGLVFATAIDAAIEAGTMHVDVQAQCETPGQEGNVPLGSVTTLVDVLPGVESVNNITPGLGGVDEETLEEAIQRFQQRAAAMAKGTLMSITAAVIAAHEGRLVRRALAADCVTDTNIPVGRIKVYVDPHTTLGSEELDMLAEAANNVRPAGAQVEVLQANRIQVDVTLSIPDAADEDVALATSAVAEHIYSLRIGEPLLRDRLVAHLVRALPQVRALNLVTPASDVGVARYEVLVPGVIQVLR